MLVQHGAKVDSSCYCNVVLNRGLQTFRSCLAITSLFNRMVRQLIVHDKQRAPESVEPENWPPNGPDLSLDYSIWRALQQLVYRHCRTRGTEHLKEVLESCKPAGSRLVRTLSIALQGRFANDCRSLLQPIEDTLSSALTNVLGSTRPLSYLHVLL